MTGDFNIRDNDWDLFYSHYLFYTDTLLEIANSLGLDLSTPINSGSTWFLNNSQNLNSVLDLMFFRIGSEEFNNHLISLDLWSPLDYVSLLMSIIMEKEFIQEKKRFIIQIVIKRKISSMSSDIE